MNKTLIADSTTSDALQMKLERAEAQRDDYQETIGSLNNALWEILYPESDLRSQ